MVCLNSGMVFEEENGVDLYGQPDVSSMIMNTPPAHDDEVQYAKNIIQAAKENQYPIARFRHLVFSSMLQPAVGGIGPHATNKCDIEGLIVQSGLPYTILHVAPHMEDIITPEVCMGERTTLPCLIDPQMDFSFISREDACEATARILLQREHHYYATYQLVGTQAPISMNRIAAKVRKVMG